MSIVVTRTGQESGIREVMDYLERRYGIPAKDICAVSVQTEVGSPIRITVTVYQQVEEHEHRASCHGPVGELQCGNQ